MTDKEAIDILQNCVADYVIGDFCVGKFCPMEEDCKDKDCPYEEAIDVVVNRIKGLEQIEADHQKTNGELREELKKKEEWIHTMQAEFDRLEGLEDNTAMLKYEKEQLERSLCNHDEIIARLEEENTKLKDKIKKESNKMRKFEKVKRVEGVDFKLPERSTKHSARI